MYHQNPETARVMWLENLTGVAIVGQDGMFLEANPAFCELIEYTEIELQDKTWMDITHPSDLKADQLMAMETAVGKRRAYTMYKRYLSKTGNIILVKLKVVAVKDGDTFEYFISQVIAVTPSGRLKAEGEDHAKKSTTVWAVLKDNWKWISIFLGSIAYIIAEVIKLIV